MSINLNTVAANLIDSKPVEFTDVSKLHNAVRKHERASAAFLADLNKLNAKEFKGSIASLAASYKADVSKSGITYDTLVPLCDSLHKRTLALRNTHKASITSANKSREAFETVRELAVQVKVLDSMMSSLANLKVSAEKIAAFVAIVEKKAA